MKRSIYLLAALTLAALPSWADFFTSAIAENIGQQDLTVSSITVGSVTMISGEDNDLCRLFAERLTSDLSVSTSYIIVDRSNLDSLLAEIEFSQNDLSTEAQVLEIGRMMGAEALVSLTIAELEEGTEVFVRLTEVTSAQLLYARSFKDFDSEPHPGGDGYNPEQDLSAADYQEIEAPQEMDSQTILLQPSERERREQLNQSYRKGNLAKLVVANRLYTLRRKNPRLFAALVESRRRLSIIARDRELFTLFLFHSPGLSQKVRSGHPVLYRRLLRYNQTLRRTRPGKNVWVLYTLKVYGPLMRKDLLLIADIRQKLAAYIKAQQG